MNGDETLIEDLSAHEALCKELLAIAQGEAETLRRGDNPSLFELCQRRKNLLPRLDHSVQRLREGRMEWKARAQEERDGQADVRRLLRRNQELCLKIMVLDRETSRSSCSGEWSPCAPRCPPNNRARISWPQCISGKAARLP